MKRRLPIRQSLRERFDAKVEPIPFSGCWIWTGGTNESGYGVIGLGRRSEGVAKAHRVAWELHRGPIPEGMNVLHRCDVPACCNPDHLFLGTLCDNAQDMVAKGRDFRPDNRGSRAKWAKLSEAQAREIAAAKGSKKGTGTDLARRFGVSKSAIYQIWAGKNWSAAL